MTLRVLFDDVSDVIGFPGLLEFAPGHEVLDLADGSDGILMSLGQAGRIWLNDKCSYHGLGMQIYESEQNVLYGMQF